MAKLIKNSAMRSSKIAGFIIAILGICVFVFGTIVSAKVKEGEQDITKGQRGVNVVRDVSKITPFTKKVGKMATRPAQQKINKGKVSAGRYKKLALWLRIGGIVLFAAGAFLLFYGYTRNSKR